MGSSFTFTKYKRRVFKFIQRPETSRMVVIVHLGSMGLSKGPSGIYGKCTSTWFFVFTKGSAITPIVLLDQLARFSRFHRPLGLKHQASLENRTMTTRKNNVPLWAVRVISGYALEEGRRRLISIPPISYVPRQFCLGGGGR